MTVTYSSEVANGSSFGCFWRILCKWRGSVYKLIWRELLAYLLIYLAINLVCRFGLNEEQKRSFEKVRQYCEKHSESIPMSFVLGFYVTLVVGRWWKQYQLLPWPDTLALFVSAAIPGVDEKGRLMRRNIVRCALLSYVITLQKVSLRVKKRFPTWQHMVDAGIMMDSEKKIFDLMDSENKISKYWLPLVWATNIITRARKETLISSDHLVQTILTELSDMRRRLGSLIGYDTVCLPLVYTQVVTLSVYSYFLAALVGRQFTPLEKAPNSNYGDSEIFFPFFTSLQFCFYIGWLKVAEVLINPFGEDDDDIELNWLIDRHLKAAYMIVDQMHEEHPELFKDQYWEEVVPKELPYTVASECYRKAEPKGSAENYKVKEADSIYSNLLAPTNPRKAHNGEDVYGEHPDLDYETVDTPMVGRKNWFQRQMHRMGSLRSTSTSYSSGRLFARTRHNSVYSSPESGIPITINGGSENGTNGVPNAIIIPSQKMSFYDRLVGRKSSRGPQKKPVSLKNRPRIPTPDVTKEVIAQESKLANPSPLNTNSSFVQNAAAYPPEMGPVLHVMLSPIQEQEGISGVTTGAGSTAALAQAVLSPALTSAGLPPMAISSTPVTLTPVVSANQFLTSFMLTPTPTGSPLPTRANFANSLHEGSRKITPPKSSVGITLTEVTSNSEDDNVNATGSNAGSINSNSSGCNSASSTSTLPLADDRTRKISLSSQIGASTTSSPSSLAAKKKEVYV